MSDARVPRGLRLGAVKAAIKASGNRDLAMAASDAPAAAAAMFTTNQFVAAPVTIGRAHLAASGGKVRGVIVNAGNANCATGDAGLAACRDYSRAAAAALDCDAQQIFPSSTGIIGVPLPAEKIVSALPALTAQLSNDAASIENFAHAIMTTDTVEKIEARAFRVNGREVRLLGFAKGAGMIHPRLGPPHATMLVFLFTDVLASPEELRRCLAPAADAGFNSISIDGDTSTNDTVLLLATGASGVAFADCAAEFTTALNESCIALAKKIVRDGEGVRHVIEISVTGARNADEARTVAKLLAHSPLVKTAWAGEDPNWGRLVSSIGAGPIVIDPQRLRLAYGPHPVFENGVRAAQFNPAAIHAYLKQPEYILHVDLGLGDATTRFWTTDLTADYVRINADYST